MLENAMSYREAYFNLHEKLNAGKNCKSDWLSKCEQNELDE